MLSIFSMAMDFGASPDAPSVHGGGDSGGGLLGLLDSFLGAAESVISGGSAWNPIAGIEALGSNLHPLIVHFPIAFLAGFLLCEIIGLAAKRPAFRDVASGMLYFGAFGAAAAAAAGLVAGNAVPHGAAVHEIMEWHERLGLTVAVLAISLALWRRFGGIPISTMAKALHLSLAVLAGVCLFFGADLGGLMVYRYGVGVQSLQLTDEAARHQHGAGAESESLPNASPPGNVLPPGTAAAVAAGQSQDPVPAPPGHEHHHHHHHHH